MTHAPTRTAVPAALVAMLAASVIGCGNTDGTIRAAGVADRHENLSESIVFDALDGPLYTVRPDGSQRRRIGTGHDVAHWSHAGDRIATSAETGGRVTTAVVSPDGSRLVNETIPDPSLNLVCFAWTASDDTLACEGWDDARPNRPAGLFTVRTAHWDHLTRVTSNPNGGHDIPGDFSPDDRQLAFTREDPPHNRFAVYVARSDGTRARRVTPWQSQPPAASWSPDGRLLLYGDGDGHLVTVQPDGIARQTVTLDVDDATPTIATQPGWSPDGRHIVFVLATTRDGQDCVAGIYTATADGRNVRAVATSAARKGLTSSLYDNPDWGRTT